MNTNLAIKKIVRATTLSSDPDHHYAKCYLIAIYCMDSLKIKAATSEMAAKSRWENEISDVVKHKLADIGKLGPIDIRRCFSYCYDVYHHYSLCYRSLMSDLYGILGNPVFLAKYCASPSTKAQQGIDDSVDGVIALRNACMEASCIVDMSQASDVAAILTDHSKKTEDLMIADHVAPHALVNALLVDSAEIGARLSQLSMSKPDEIISDEDRRQVEAKMATYHHTLTQILIGVRTLDAGGLDASSHLGFYLGSRGVVGERVALWAAKMALQFAVTDTLPQNTRVMTPREYLNL